MATDNPTPGGIRNQARKLTPGTLMEFILFDASRIPSAYTGLAGPVFACHNYNDYGAEPLLWQGVAYQPFPVLLTGLEVTSAVQQPRPTLTVGNLAAVAYSGGVFSSLLREFDDLVGAQITRKLTFLRYLDTQPILDDPTSEFKLLNPNEPRTPDPNQQFPDQVFYLDRKVQETKSAVQFELATAIDTEGVQIPRRQLCANQCPWLYRSGSGCDYAGPPVADQYDVPLTVTRNRNDWRPQRTYLAGDYVYVVVGPGADVYTAVGDSIFNTNGNTTEYFVAKQNIAAGMYPPAHPELWAADVCSKTLTACKLRFGQNAILPFGGFPAIARAPQA